MSNKIDGALTVGGALTANSLNLQTGTISADRIGRRVAAFYSQATNAVVASETRMVYIANASGSVVGVDCAVETAATGGDKAFTVDVKKSTAGGSFASVLSATQSLSSSSTAKTVYSPTISTASYTTGDLYQVVITTSGSTGTQAYGVNVTLTFDENPS